MIRVIEGKKRSLKWVMKARDFIDGSHPKLEVGHILSGVVAASDGFRIHAIQRYRGLPVGEKIVESGDEYCSVSKLDLKTNFVQAVRSSLVSEPVAKVVLDVTFLKEALSGLSNEKNMLLPFRCAAKPILSNLA